MNKELLISIITVNYNDAEGLERTIQSVQPQTYTNFEHIIIDGDSCDGSKEVIEKHQNSFSYWISESDSGIYNAMNKGIKVAKGEYLLFLNSGDYFAENNVLEQFIASRPIEDIIFGDVWITGRQESPIYKKMPEVLDATKCLQFTITHQAIFHKKELFIDKRYDEKYLIIADWVFYNKAILIDKASYKHLNFPIAIYDGTGMSSDDLLLKNREKERVLFLKEIAPFVIEELLRNKGNVVSNVKPKRFIFRLAKKIDIILIKLGL